MFVADANTLIFFPNGLDSKNVVYEHMTQS